MTESGLVEGTMGRLQPAHAPGSATPVVPPLSTTEAPEYPSLSLDFRDTGMVVEWMGTEYESLNLRVISLVEVDNRVVGMLPRGSGKHSSGRGTLLIVADGEEEKVKEGPSTNLSIISHTPLFEEAELICKRTFSKLLLYSVITLVKMVNDRRTGRQHPLATIKHTIWFIKVEHRGCGTLSSTASTHIFLNYNGLKRNGPVSQANYF
ncbi:hypothetical protein K435DRAFT_797623 [Dendrothele bispora CBS 962.96]|uniref:Uncharacterized protein n=1 Tax=Dendrothele bispora (strain CBS 962.96) TaxID=1314807 RepID=A0A4S8M2E4_DENBC|nr:hypothetical protein K435DRAFT_797623 [Dendrothele bispora CBS 962.96]